MAFNNKEQPVLVVGPFVGLDATTDPTDVDSQHAVDCSNIGLNRQPGSYVPIQGRTTQATLSSALNADIEKFYTAPTTVWYLAFCKDGNIYKFQSGGGTSLKSGLNTSTVGKFVTSQKWAFFTNFVDTPLKIDNAFNVTNWGVDAPITAPTVSAGITSAQVVHTTNASTPSIAVSGALQTTNPAGQTSTTSITCRATVHKPDPHDPDTWYTTYNCNATATTPGQWPVSSGAPVAMGSQITFKPVTITSTTSDTADLQVMLPNGTVVFIASNITAGTTYHYFDAAAVAGTYTWQVVVNTDGDVGTDLETYTGGSHDVTVTPQLTYYAPSGSGAVTNGISTFVTIDPAEAPVDAGSQITIKFTSVVTPSDANGTANYAMQLTDSSGKVWKAQSGIVGTTTVNFFDTAAPSDTYTLTVYATVTPGGGGGASTYICSCAIEVDWTRITIVDGALTPGGEYAYVVTFATTDGAGRQIMESSPSPVSAFFVITQIPGTGSVNLAGTSNLGDVIGINILQNGQTVANIQTAELQAGKTASQAAQLLTAAFQSAFLATSSLFIQQGVKIGLSNTSGTVTFTDYAGVQDKTTPFAIFVYSFNATSGVAGGITVNTAQGANASFSGGSHQTSIALLNVPTSTDPQVSERNIYRIGGSQSQFQEVGNIADNVTTTFVDTLADDQITGQTLVPHRDPPKPFLDTVVYQDRTWGFGYTSSDPSTMEQVWYSLYRQPWAFDDTNQVLVLGENPGNDPLVGGAALPNMVMGLKRQSTWGVVGSSQADYLPIPLFEIGAAGKQSIKTAYGMVFWLSPEGIIYMFDGASAPQDISTMTASKFSVKGILDSYTLADFQAAVGFFNRNCYYLSFPTKGVTLSYFLPAQSWAKISFATDAVEYDVDGEEVIGSVVGSGQVTNWFASETDLGNPIVSSWTSNVAEDPNGGATTARHLVATAVGNSSGTLNVQITANDGGGNVSNTQTFPIGTTNRQTASLPPTLIGQTFQMVISATTSSKTTVNGVALYAYPKRVLSVKG